MAMGADMKFAAWILAALVFAAGPAAADPLGGPPVRTVYTIKQKGGGLGVMVDEIVIVQLAGAGADQAWVLERRRFDQNLAKKTFRHQWIDGRTCPAVAGVLDRIWKLAPVGFAGPDITSSGWVSDTPSVSLMGPPAGYRMGDFVLRRDMGGPVSKWWWSSEAALESCWREAGVAVGGDYVWPKLGSDEEAVAAGRP